METKQETKLAPIEYTNGEILAMGALLPDLVKLDVPARTGARIQRLAQEINKDYVIVKGQLDDLVRKYGVQTGEGRDAKFTLAPESEKWPEYLKERADLLSDVVTRASWTPVVLPANTAHVSAALLITMERLVSVFEE
jgi:hypothetical protein